MVDLSKEFETFYNNHVVLSRKDQNELRKKKNTNIKRLKSGLIEYNKENYTSYSVADTLVQGSMAMYTVVQNDNKDYDIDVAIIFDKDNLGNDIGAIKAKNIVCEALKKKCTQLKNDPEVKKNCVTVSYTDGYHIDFAVYRRYKKYSWDEEYTYEHAGPQQWEERNPKAINEWFSDEIDNKGIVLRKVIRLSKMFCKSRDSWGEMPGGLIQTVLCDEKIMAYRYYSTRRPLMVGGIPSTESVTEIVNFESGRTYCEEIDNKAWGYIEYATPLDPQQASDYELVLAPQKPSIPKPPLNRQEVYHE